MAVINIEGGFSQKIARTRQIIDQSLHGPLMNLMVGVCRECQVRQECQPDTRGIDLQGKVAIEGKLAGGKRCELIGQEIILSNC